MSIASAITAAQGRVAAAYTSCNTMGATMPAPSDQDLSHLPATIESIPSGGGNPEAEENDVIFIDYDGTIRYSYSAADFANLTALPANPSHTGLTAQGWNWTLADAQAYVAQYGSLVVGQNYITDDGKTRLYIRIANPGRMTVPLWFYDTAANNVEIDWGDGSSTETVGSGGIVNPTHTYSSPGDYVITYKVLFGTIELGGGSSNWTVVGASTNSGRVYLNMLRKIEIGAGVTALRNNSCQNTMSLDTVSVPNTVTSVGANTFSSSSLRAFVYPSTVTNVQGNTFYNYQVHISVSFCKQITAFSNPFTYNYGITKVSIPPSVTSFTGNTFYNCYSLAKIVVPAGVTDIGSSCFQNCHGLKELWLHPTTPPTFGANALTNTPADLTIYVPRGYLATYQGATGWSAYASQMIEMPA